MAETENTNQDIEVLKAKLGQLLAAYNELKTLNESDAHQETLREGFLVKAGKNTETILKYICKRENIIVTTKPQNGKINDTRIPMLNDYIYHLKDKKIINEDIHHHLEIIKKWRNRSAHDLSDDNSTIDFIKDSTIESVNDSFNYFRDWFFKKYLNDQQSEFANSSYSSVNQSKDISPEEFEKIQDRWKNNPLGIPDFSILSKSNRATKKKKRIGWIVVCLLVIGATIIYLPFLNKNSVKAPEPKKPVPVVPKQVHMTNDQVYDFLVRYFDSNNSKTFDAYDFFANDVDQYYLKFNQNPSQINHDESRKDYINTKSVIDKKTITMVSSNGNIDYWQFWSDFTCYRPSKKKYEKCRGQTEVGLNSKSKMTAIREIGRSTLSFSKKRPW